MATKVKGLLKGLRYISQIFDEEKEKEIQIGFPTDVKHVAHIGWDGPSTDNNPSWMKEFNGPGQFQSAPLVPPASDNPEIKWVSEDSNRRSRNANSSSVRDQPEQSKSTRHHSSSKENGGTDSPKKSKSSRRHRRKDSADDLKHGRIPLDSAAGSESPARDLPNIPKKSRRKKSKESVPGGTVAGSRSSKSKGTSSSTAAAPASDPRSEGAIQSSRNNESIVS
ncbi:CRIB domain-containing protein RIC6-like [Solanum dulcamara]|uniref:CRIB domain-containing protein RIC6-like n=1 Tax=Solanum dulcamara TaxID=45834 RepID=UPI0024861DFD|nr:CRIB domain-containing protein RIC6-like [Solanum dulcamara]